MLRTFKSFTPKMTLMNLTVNKIWSEIHYLSSQTHTHQIIDRTNYILSTTRNLNTRWATFVTQLHTQPQFIMPDSMIWKNIPRLYIVLGIHLKFNKFPIFYKFLCDVFLRLAMISYCVIFLNHQIIKNDPGVSFRIITFELT